jgi:GrpB-like predicted nucleotidyltransferase (UPF0157 family)
MLKADKHDAVQSVASDTPRQEVVQLFPYDPLWPQRFEQEKLRIRGALADRALLIEHAGSTSIPGIVAKPVIDIILAVPKAANEAAYVPALEGVGYWFRVREPDWFEHRLMKRDEPAVNLHIFPSRCSEIGRMLLFRDWLRVDTGDRTLYAATKETLARQEWKRIQDYADAKAPVVADIMTRAAAWDAAGRPTCS